MLARGGMAEVFLARMSGVGGFAKLLVIKRILPHLNDDPEFRAMFVNEGRVAARLNHPNICQVFELGEEQGEVFLAMEYLDGLPWADLVPHLPRGRGVELRVTATVLAQICEGLRFAHEHTDVDGTPMPIVHRDVSPQNLMITTEGVCKLLDFGVSKVLTEGSRTRSGMLKGKLPYMAPEQIRGEALDARADVFSIGVVLWEALTGERLFQRDSDYQIWKAITEEDIPRVTARVSGLPPEIDAVVARALERDVQRRYPSIRHFAAELRDVAARAGGTFDNGTLAQVLKSLGAGKLADKHDRVSRAVGRPARASGEVPPLPAAITQPSPIVETSDTHSIALRDASVTLRRKPRGWRVALGVGALAIAAGVTGALLSTRGSSGASGAPADAQMTALTAAETAALFETAAPPRELDPDLDPDPDPELHVGEVGVAAPDATRPAKRQIAKRPGKKPSVDADVAEPGFYSVDSKPYATIYIDDKSYGDTPLFKVQLPAGKHRVRAVRADGKSQRLTITIQPGKLTTSGTLTW
jgi:eukaryotic-like serine/threonine-protein kinase